MGETAGYEMAKEGKKLELWEIVAKKRAKDQKPITPPPPPPPPQPAPEPSLPVIVDKNGRKVIIDPSMQEYPNLVNNPDTQPDDIPPPDILPDERPVPKDIKTPEDPIPPSPAVPEIPDLVPEQPRRRSPREVVFALDTAFIFFTIILALICCSYFLGYKRGQEERPASGTMTEIESADPARIDIQHLQPPPRTVVSPSEQDYTLMLRTEPASDDLPERLQLELAEAVARGRQQSGREIQGFIFLTSGNDPRYVLTVGLGRSFNDQDLNDLQRIYYQMDGLTLSRTPTPYRASRVASVKELGRLVY